eukprot:4905238-Pleurochrysis_carterae.AAC.1
MPTADAAAAATSTAATESARATTCDRASQPARALGCYNSVAQLISRFSCVGSLWRVYFFIVAGQYGMLGQVQAALHPSKWVNCNMLTSCKRLLHQKHGVRGKLRLEISSLCTLQNFSHRGSDSLAQRRQ